MRLFQLTPDVMAERLSEGQVGFCLASEVLDGRGWTMRSWSARRSCSPCRPGTGSPVGAR
ncbi:hypothetical protein ACWEPL_59885 [Nonomuraea sp. NPDC004186]|uniref:hypothetical protein n=1 Tax=Nonomuraea sp. NPDC049625 TaxID=3155775 RepID=UPI003431C4F0